MKRNAAYQDKKIFMVMEGSSRNFSFSTKKQVNMTTKTILSGSAYHYVLKLIDIT
jgi:hypothetical protein